MKETKEEMYNMVKQKSLKSICRMLSEISDQKKQKAIYHTNSIHGDYWIINFISSLEMRGLHAGLTAITICRVAP